MSNVPQDVIDQEYKNWRESKEAYEANGWDNTFDYTAKCNFEAGWKAALRHQLADATRKLEEARKDALNLARLACIEVHADACEAAKAKDATTYEAGYQDAAIDCDEAIRAIEQGKEN